jgi:hypothetical protein
VIGAAIELHRIKGSGLIEEIYSRMILKDLSSSRSLRSSVKKFFGHRLQGCATSVVTPASCRS